MPTERVTKLRYSRYRQPLQVKVRELELAVTSLRADNQALKETVDWSEDPAVRRARRSNTVMVLGSVGWWGGAVGTTEAAKIIAAFYLTGNELAAFGLAAWMVSCSVIAGPTERVAKSLTVNLTKGRTPSST